MTTTIDTSLRDRALALAGTAACLGRRVEPLLDDAHLEGLIGALSRIDPERFTASVEALDHWRASRRLEAATLTGRWVRWFDLGRVAPYEGSNVTLSAGGVTPRLAEIAGYYRAFGMHVHHNRPDHVVAELEFLAFCTLLEFDARTTIDDERAEIAAGAARSFIRDHIGTWLRPWSERVRSELELGPWHGVAHLAADLVDHEARLRNVVPIVAGPPRADDGDDAADLRCGSAS